MSWVRALQKYNRYSKLGHNDNPKPRVAVYSCSYELWTRLLRVLFFCGIFMFLLIVYFHKSYNYSTRFNIRLWDFSQQVPEPWELKEEFLNELPFKKYVWVSHHPFKRYYRQDHPKHIHTTCVIPDLHPLSEVVLLKSPVPDDHVHCQDKRKPFCFVNYENRSLHLTADLKSCYYEEAIRENDDVVGYVSKKPLTDRSTEIRLKNAHVQFIRVSCLSNGTTVRQLHLVDPDWFEEVKTPKNDSNRQSILVFVLESMSRLSFIRYLPKTYLYLKNTLNSVVFQLHHKTGENTFPNLMTVLGGTNESHFKYFDKAPLLFFNFRDKGYKTYYSEDMSAWNTFNFWYKNGFVNQPTDHYLRLFWKESESSNDFDCYFGKPRYEVELPYLKYILLKPQSNPIFALNFFVHFTHSYASAAWAADDYFVSFFKGLEKSVLSGKLLLITMGDHGHRFSPLVSTYQGFVELNLPFLAIATSDENTRSILNINSKRLTSQYDLHETLLNIVRDKGKVKEEPHGINLLNDIVPHNRTCQQAGVDGVYCMCASNEPDNQQKILPEEVANKAVVFINDMLKKNAEAEQKCSVLKLERVEDTFQNSNKHIIVFRTQPGAGLFQIILEGNSNSTKIEEKMFNRVNAYGQPCVKHDILRKYCSCK